VFARRNHQAAERDIGEIQRLLLSVDIGFPARVMNFRGNQILLLGRDDTQPDVIHSIFRNVNCSGPAMLIGLHGKKSFHDGLLIWLKIAGTQ